MAGQRRLGTGAILLTLLLLGGGVSAQDGDDGAGDQGPLDGADRVDRLFLAIDDDLQDGLRRADEMAARGQWDRVVDILDRLLAQGGAELAPAQGEVHTGSRAAVRARLAALPPEARAVYAQLHDDAALRLLEAGQRRADPAPLLEVVARHPASRAVYSARALLATRFLERGQPAAALAQLDALLERAGVDPGDRARFERARVVALALLGRMGEAESALERIPDAAELRARVTAIARGLEPPPQAPPAKPAARAWSQPVLGYYETSTEGTPAWSVPEADATHAYVHDGSHALAVELATGKLAWRAPLRPEDAFRRPDVPDEHRVVLAPGLVVCLVPGVGLVALDRDTGRERWRRGLPALKREAGIDFPARLSGAPRQVGPRVAFALVTEHETREVHLLAVDLATGDFAWSAYLASQTQGLDPQVVLAATDERVVAVTGLGIAVALDSQGEVLWARRYDSIRDERDRRGGGGIPGMPQRQDDGTWGPPQKPERAPSAAVVRGTVWAAPADARRVWAWDLRTGEVEAALARPENAKILAARGTELVLASAEGDVFLATKAGAELVAQVGGEPVGRPALAGGRVYVPRKDGLVEVDLATRQARVVAPARAELGHLAASGGLLLSAAPGGLFAFGRDLDEGQADDPFAGLADARAGAREAATAALLAQGEAARPRLTELLTGAHDPEQRHRARVVLAELDRKDRLARWGPIVKQQWTAVVPDLLNRITHPNPEVRLEALREMGAIQDADVGTLLLGLLEDHDPRVAFTAAGTLLSRGDRTGVPLLARAVKEGVPSDRVAALVAARDFGKPEDMAWAHLALDDREPEVRAAGVTAVLKLGGASAVHFVEPLVKDPEDAVRLAILHGVSGSPEPACVALVIALSTDPNDMIRTDAVRALAKVRTPEAGRALGVAMGDKDPVIAREACVALFKIAQQGGVLVIPPEAIERGSRFKDVQARDHVAQITMHYVRKGGVVSVATLTRFLCDEEEQIRAWRIGKPGERKRGWQDLILDHVQEVAMTPADVAAVASNTQHAEAQIRLWAYQTLGVASFAPGAGAQLAQGLDDQDPQIRRECGRWLTRPEAAPGLLDADAAYEALRVAALSLRPEGREAARTVLDVVPRPVLVPALLRGLRTPNEALQVAAGQRLARITANEPPFVKEDLEGAQLAFGTWWWRQTHPGQTIEDTVKALGDENPTARWRAAQDLSALPLPLARNALAASLGGEGLEWVLDAKLEALVAVLGEPLGYKKGLSLLEKRACADRLRMRVVELIQDEVRRGR